MEIYSLTTKRLQLRPVAKTDLDTLHRIWTLPEVRKYLWDDEIVGKDRVMEIIEKSLGLFASENRGLWLIIERSRQAVIGFTGLWDFFEEPQPQLVFGLVPEKFKKGFATEAAQAIIDYCKKTLGYHYIIGSCDSPHEASRRVMIRLGMKEIESKVANGKPTTFFKKNFH